MKATARRTGKLAHTVAVRQHTLVSDEPQEVGGEDTGPDPQELLAVSLAACTAATVELYADRKDWDVGDVEVSVEYELAPRGEATHFEVVLTLPAHLDEEQVARILTIAGKCPVHRTLEGPVTFSERVERRP